MLVPSDMISERFERFEVAVANQAEENCLLSCFPVLVAEVFRNLPVRSKLVLLLLGIETET